MIKFCKKIFFPLISCIYSYGAKSFLSNYFLTVDILVTSHLSQFINIDSEFLDVKNAAEMEMTDSSSPRVRSRIGNVLMCFSIYTSTKMIFSTELDAEAIPVIHGIRFLSMIWIIIAHTVLYTAEYFGKCADTKKIVESFTRFLTCRFPYITDVVSHT